MTPHLAFHVDDPSRVGEARRAALDIAKEQGCDDVACGRVALIVTELGTNLVRHATGGRILMAPRQDGTGPGVDVLSLDTGPGMADLDRCMADGYSTAGTPGNGLGAIRRICDDFSIHSQVDAGTVIYASVAQPSSAAAPKTHRFSVAGICLAAPGETVSGDGWAIHRDGHTASVIVADGLGHGPVAAEAATAALTLFETRRPGSGPAHWLGLAHEALRSTRGAAIAVADLDADAGTVTFAGAGNIAGRLVSGVEDRSLLSQHGTVGLQIRRLHDLSYPWGDHVILVLHSDGIATRWSFDRSQGLLQCHPAVIAGWLIRDHSRGRDDATVVVIRRH